MKNSRIRTTSMMPTGDLEIILWNIYKSDPTKPIVEIGVWRGETTKTIAEEFPHRIIIGIDPFEKFSDNNKKWPTGVGSKDICLRNCIMPNIEIIDDFSNNVTKIPCSVLIIDGDHSASATKKDLEWSKYADITLIHDINYPSVRRALTGYEYEILTDTLGRVKC